MLLLRQIIKLCFSIAIGLSCCGSSYCQVLPVLERLKDAVLGAEGVVSDIFSSLSLDYVMEAVKFTKEVWDDTVEEECKFSCPNGKTPKKNKYHKPTVNGCGPLGMEIDMRYLPSEDMTKCCNLHDMCYGTCNKDKDECELAFKKCLYKVCDNSKIGKTDADLLACKTTAKLLYSGAITFGCKFYKAAQQEACYCGSGRYPADEL